MDGTRTAGPVAVLGLGVMGGSLVRDLSARGVVVRCWSPDAGEVAAASALPGVAPLAGPDRVAGCAGVVVASHLSTMAPLFREVARGADPSAWVVDLGSLQGPPLRWMARAGLAGRGVSCHPMAGGEGSGFEASTEGLYRGVRVWTTPAAEGGEAGQDPAATPGDALESVHAFWRELGARPLAVDPRVHDARMGWISHLPQVVSVHLARALEAEGYVRGELGGGGRDMTRLAGSGHAMWEDILGAEPRAAVPGLRVLARRLSRAADQLEAGDPAPFLAELDAGRRWHAGQGGGRGEAAPGEEDR